MSVDKVKKRALRMLERRDYGRDELVNKLVQKGELQQDAEAVADRMVELSFINDENYAAMVVRHYAAKGFGRSRISAELRRRILPRELLDSALEELPDQGDTVIKLLRAKLISEQPDRDEIRRASNTLIRRGFSYDQVREALDRLRAEEEAY